MSNNPYEISNKSTRAHQSVSTGTMLFGESDEAYDNDHKSAGCCACSANISNIFYGIILIVGTVGAYAAKYVSQQTGISWWHFCPKDNTNPLLRDLCVQNQTIYRISFVLALFFLLMTVVTFISRKFHYESWIIKGSIISAVFSASFFIPGRFFMVYRDIARWASFLFIAMQVLVLVDFAHSLHENIVKNVADDDDTNTNSTKARAIYLALSIVSIIAFIVGIVFLFVRYNFCPLHAGMTSVTLILGLGSIALSLVLNKGLLPPSLIALYTTHITYQALTTNTTEQCSAAGHTTTTMPTWLMIISFLFTIGQIAWMAIRAGQANRMYVESSIKNYTQNSSPLSSSPSSSDPYASLDSDSSDSRHSRPNWDSGIDGNNNNNNNNNVPSHWIFHLSFFLCSLYIAMLLTGWGSSTPTDIHNPEASKISFWIKIVSVWASFALYAWTLIAPTIFPDRDFS